MTHHTTHAHDAPLRVILDHDADALCPNAWGGWRLVSFARRHVSYDDPGRFCSGLDRWGDPVPAHLGIQRKLAVGTAFWLSYFEHGLCRWSLQDEGPRCPWDSVRIAGILLWEGPLRGLPRDHRSRVADARRFVEAFTQWANGEVYAFRIEDAHGRVLAACGGYHDVEALIAEVRQHTGDRGWTVSGDAAWLAEHHRIRPEE